jgi:hypothetical protein
MENAKQTSLIGKECITARKLQFGGSSDCNYRRKKVQAIIEATN